MSHILMLIPTGPDVGLTTVALGLMRAIDNLGISVGFYKPVSQFELGKDHIEHSTALAKLISNIESPKSISLSKANAWLGSNRTDELLEEVIARFEPMKNTTDIVVVEGLVPTKAQAYAMRLNMEIAKALGARIVLVAADNQGNEKELQNQVEIAANNFGGLSSNVVQGVIINKVGFSHDETYFSMQQQQAIMERKVRQRLESLIDDIPLLRKKSIALLGAIPWSNEFMAPRVIDVANYLDAKVFNEGDYESRRVKRVSLCARSMENMTQALKPGTLIVTAGDRSDIIMATAMAALNGVNIAGLVLTGNYRLKKGVIKLCRNALKTGLPVLSASTDSFTTATLLHNFNVKIPINDKERIDATTDNTARHIHTDWIQALEKRHYEKRLSPPAFRYQLIARAHAAKKRIVLPEGNEPRTIAAASICQRRGIAQCVLLGKRDEIKRTAINNGVEFDNGIEIIEPESVLEDYVEPMVALRKHKNLTALLARQQLRDTVVLGTMMLQLGHVDGLVSGAEHTTANTIRPALQLIKTADNAKLVSSVFFMCLPEQVLIYGDCAVNPNPNHEELADIAIQSADSATAFGIEPKIAMISYSTGASGSGGDVDKVRKATELVKQLRPDLLVDGPLQYDAAFMETVAKQKAPDSPVAGKATVFIFPDLNTGNTTYKAVQRSANVVCIGPMLQGLRKPVNDLSRGALVDDIVFTIALTAIQS